MLFRPNHPYSYFTHKTPSFSETRTKTLSIFRNKQHMHILNFDNYSYVWIIVRSFFSQYFFVPPPLKNTRQHCLYLFLHRDFKQITTYRLQCYIIYVMFFTLYIFPAYCVFYLLLMLISDIHKVGVNVTQSRNTTL